MSWSLPSAVWYRSFRGVPPSRPRISSGEIVEAQASTVVIARDLRDNGRIVGMLTLVVFRIPTGVRAWIEDVVVDETVRGRGVGEALSQEAHPSCNWGGRANRRSHIPTLARGGQPTLSAVRIYPAREQCVPLHPMTAQRSERTNEMIKAVDIKAELAGRPVLSERGKDTTDAEAAAAFAVLAPFRDGSIFAGSFSERVPGSAIGRATSSCTFWTAPPRSPS